MIDIPVKHEHEAGRPLISVVVAVFNGANIIQRCIDSVANQAFPSRELIIMDSASTDGTVSVLEKNSPDIAYWESKKDRGIAHAWNKALRQAQGDWIIFLGADDRLQDSGVFSDVSEYLRCDPDHDIVYGRIVFEGGTVHGLVLGADCDLRTMRRRMVIPNPAAFYRRSLFDEIGSFDESFRVAMDYELLLRKKSLSVNFMDRIVTVMGGEGVSSVLTGKTLLEGRAAQIKNRVDRRIRIEGWHMYYQLRYQLNRLLAGGITA